MFIKIHQNAFFFVSFNLVKNLIVNSSLSSSKLNDHSFEFQNNFKIVIFVQQVKFYAHMRKIYNN